MIRQLDEWVRFAWPERLRSARAAVASEIALPPELPAADEMERATRPMQWLLERCAAGVTLTHSGHLPPVLVAEAVDEFDWWPFGGKPRSEVDVPQLEILRTAVRRSRLTFRRGRRLSATHAGHALLDDRAALWRAVALGVGSFDDYSRAVSELVALRMLAGPAEEDDLLESVIPIVVVQVWGSGSRQLDANEIRWSIHEPLRYWRLFGLLDEPPRFGRESLLTPWTVSFTPAGRHAALAFLHALATAVGADSNRS